MPAASAAMHGMPTCTSPATTRTGSESVRPSSGAMATPSVRPITQLCSGQATVSPDTMPSDSGPRLCGHSSISANTRSSAVRKTAIGRPRWPKQSRRAPCRGMFSSGPIFFQANPSRRGPWVTPPPAPAGGRTHGHRRPRARSRPGSCCTKCLGMQEAGVKRLAAGGVFDQARLHIGKARRAPTQGAVRSR